jgi:hypothetical protein
MRKESFIGHGQTCPRCNPCPHLQAAIREVCDWREARLLLSRAEVLRAEQHAVEATAARAGIDHTVSAGGRAEGSTDHDERYDGVRRVEALS